MPKEEKKRSIPTDHATRRRDKPYNEQVVYEPPRQDEIKDTEQLEIAEEQDLYSSIRSRIRKNQNK